LFSVLFSCPNKLSSTVIMGLLENQIKCSPCAHYVHSGSVRSSTSHASKRLPYDVASEHSTPWFIHSEPPKANEIGMLRKASKRPNALHTVSCDHTVHCYWCREAWIVLGILDSLTINLYQLSWCHQVLCYYPNTCIPMKNDNVVKAVELSEANPMYAEVRHEDGKEWKVSKR